MFEKRVGGSGTGTEMMTWCRGAHGSCSPPAETEQPFADTSRTRPGTGSVMSRLVFWISVHQPWSSEETARCAQGSPPSRVASEIQSVIGDGVKFRMI